jgi:hypothetical protein
MSLQAIGSLLTQTACGVRGYNSQLAIQGTTRCHLVLPFQSRIINERETQREAPCPEHPNCAVCRKHKLQGGKMSVVSVCRVGVLDTVP